MKTKSLFLILFICLSIKSYGGNETGTITIKIKNIPVATGAIHLAIYDKPENFLKDNSFLDKKVTVTGEELIIVLNDIPYGEYAISLFHDENGNDKMDMFLGFIPKEAYGFSNNARGSMGPPTFEQAKFLVNKKEMEMNIKVEK